MIAKVKITTQEGEKTAFEPLIISASRATDIPAFYTNWLIKQFQRGYIVKKNPFNNQNIYISLKKVRFIIFWSKNPMPIIKKLGFFDDLNINYYFLYTLNFYPEYELNLPSFENRIETFKLLSTKIGKEKVIWRFDPLIISDKIDENQLFDRIKKTGDAIHLHTKKLIVSFLDLHYKKLSLNAKRYNANFKDFSENQKIWIIKKLKELADNWQIEIKTCATKEDFAFLGVERNKCIDDELIASIASEDCLLMNYLDCNYDIFLKKYICKNAKKDKGQRKYCQCIETKDIGMYDSCLHECIYCYANKNFEVSKANFEKIIKML
jgi:hypothetical protein